MTDFQAKQIRELRMRGVGYRAIASVIGLSRDIVRNYCKTHGLDGLASELTINMKEQMQQGKACLSCGKELKQPATGRKRKFCSDSCRREWWAEHSDSIQRKETAFYDKNCAYCGDTFTVYGNKNRKYCSHTCYVHDRFWRKEEGRAPYVSPSKSEEEKNESNEMEIDTCR
ncbi:hypothetical protein [Alkaliphilus transvaalensis]|uniref:hypothetical protein n=1 Tax=Alkaliphilus transvaalensis TaxID=114628 RepID=UPI0006858DD4|nr:hypothetical protein [Alkaliphilus transvaalensis]